jgi:hypothetical protein
MVLYMSERETTSERYLREIVDTLIIGMIIADERIFYIDIIYIHLLVIRFGLHHTCQTVSTKTLIDYSSTDHSYRR